MSEAVSIVPSSPESDPVRRALDCLSEGFQVIGPDWRYIYVNPSAAKHGRRSADQLAGRLMTEVYPGIEATPLFGILRQCMEERSTHVIENQFTFPDGTDRWFELRIQPVPGGICIYSSDIEDRKRRRARGSFGQRLWRLIAGGD